MKLRESPTLWGIPVAHLKEYSKKYKLYTGLLYIFDIFLMFVLTAFMYFNDINYRAYGFIVVAVCLGIHFVGDIVLNVDKWEAFRFYKKYSGCTIITKSYDMDEEKMYSMLYCMAFKRLKQNKSFDTYKELILSACCENTKNASKVMKYLKKYESDSGSLICNIIIKGKSQYFIDFKGDSENEYDNSGAVEDTETTDAD